mgnify:CR=1 FL=1
MLEVKTKQNTARRGKIGLLNDGKLHDVSERDKYYQTAANVQYKLTPLCIYK